MVFTWRALPCLLSQVHSELLFCKSYNHDLLQHVSSSPAEYHQPHPREKVLSTLVSSHNEYHHIYKYLEFMAL